MTSQGSASRACRSPRLPTGYRTTTRTRTVADRVQEGTRRTRLRSQDDERDEVLSDLHRCRQACRSRRPPPTHGQTHKNRCSAACTERRSSRARLPTARTGAASKSCWQQSGCTYFRLAAPASRTAHIRWQGSSARTDQSLLRRNSESGRLRREPRSMV